VNTANETADVEPLDLDARYGRSPGLSRRNRYIAIGVAAAFALVFGAWVVWAGLAGQPAELEVRTTSEVVSNDSEVTVGFELSVPVGTTSSCAVQALNESFTVVGWKIVDIPASENRTRSFTESVRTTEPAVTGLIYRCWLT
jgi:hypothetical protein